MFRLHGIILFILFRSLYHMLLYNCIIVIVFELLVFLVVACIIFGSSDKQLLRLNEMRADGSHWAGEFVAFHICVIC